MAFDDLDLEFEDEEEQKKKKNDAVHFDVDLEFAGATGPKPKVVSPSGAPKAETPNQAPTSSAPNKTGEVRKIEDARAAQAQVRKPQAAAPVATQSRVAGTSALKQDVQMDLDSAAIIEMREQMRRMEIESEVKVKVAEFKTEYLTEMLSDMKLMEHQIGQLILRINAKHPDMKNEVLTIKKILADFVQKKRK